MASFSFASQMKIKSIQKRFKKEFGLTLRIYDGGAFAEGDQTLSQVCKQQGKSSVLSVSKNIKVGNLENKIAKELGIRVRIAGSDDSYHCKGELTLTAALRADAKKLERKAKKKARMGKNFGVEAKPEALNRKILIATIGANTKVLASMNKKEFTKYYFLLANISHGFEQKTLMQKIAKLCGGDFKPVFIFVDPDDMNKTFDSVLKIIEDTKDPLVEVVVNPTGGTTSMTIGAYRASVLGGAQTQLSTGKRNKENQVFHWDSRWVPIDRTSIEIHENEILADKWLNKFDYESVYEQFKKYYGNTTHYERPMQISRTAQAFMEWDRLNFSVSLKIMASFDTDRKKKYFSKYLDCLAQLKKVEEEELKKVPTNFLINEFWNSAERSAARGFYSESFLKFYRMLEAACQSVLQHSYNAYAGHICDKIQINEWGIKVNKSGAGNVSMTEMIQIFKQNDTSKELKLRRFLVDNEERIKDQFSFLRNTSIFAHGYKVITKENWNEAQEFWKNEFFPLLKEDEYALRYVTVPQLPSSLEEFRLINTGED